MVKKTAPKSKYLNTLLFALFISIVLLIVTVYKSNLPVVVQKPVSINTTTPPSTISALFSAVKTQLKCQSRAMMEPTFYSFQDPIKKTSWKIDLTPVIKTKSDRVNFNNVMMASKMKETDWADGMGQSVTKLEGNGLICYFFSGKDSFLSCTTK